MGDVNNVSAAKPRVAGGIYRAPLGTPIPTSATDTLNSAFENLGYISEDGITNAKDADIDTEKAWGGDTVNVLDNGVTNTYQYKLLETINVAALKDCFGDENVSGTLATGITVLSNSKEHTAHIYVIDMVLKNGVLKRIVIPNGMISDFGDIVYNGTESTGYELTVTAQNDEAGNDSYTYIVSAGSTTVGE